MQTFCLGLNVLNHFIMPVRNLYETQNEHRQHQGWISSGNGIKWVECSLTMGTECSVRIFNFILNDSIGLWVGIIWTVKLTLEMLTVHWQQIRFQLTMLLRNDPGLWNENVATQGFEFPAFGFVPGDLPLQPMRPDMPNLMFWLVFDFVFSHPKSKFCAIALVIQP